MPVTAKLSRKFYERFGDDIAGELVDWFNAVDVTYQNQLRDINELNWERFKATLLAEVASLRAESNGLRTELRAEINALRTELRAEFRAGLAELHADLMRWMFIYWTGSLVGRGGLIVGMALFGPR